MKQHIKIGLLAICLVVAQTLRAVKTADELLTYYTTTISTSINNLSGADLFNAVHTAAKYGYKSLSYSDLWTAYQTTDTRADGTIWDMYGGCSFTYSTDQCGNYQNECDCYNREHSIPKSWFGGSENANSPGTDLFHVVPTDGKVNGMRSNYAFGEVSSATYTYGNSRLGTATSITIAGTLLSADDYTVSCTTSPVFEPADEYKGDFARGYMGTLLRWANGDYQAFTTGNGAAIFSGNYTASGRYGLTAYGVALLMKWHRQDPVSDKEIARNDAVQAKQGNRNPFIDYPELAEYLWGCKAGEAFPVASQTPYVNNATTGSGSTGEIGKEQYTHFVTECSAITWTITFEDKMHGTTIPSQTVSDGGTFTFPSVEDKTKEAGTCAGEHYHFVGWLPSTHTATPITDEDLYTAGTTSKAVTADATYFAVWAKETEQ